MLRVGAPAPHVVPGSTVYIQQYGRLNQKIKVSPCASVPLLSLSKGNHSGTGSCVSFQKCLFIYNYLHICSSGTVGYILFYILLSSLTLISQKSFHIGKCRPNFFLCCRVLHRTGVVDFIQPSCTEAVWLAALFPCYNQCSSEHIYMCFSTHVCVYPQVDFQKDC